MPVYRDSTMRAQIGRKQSNLDFHKLLITFHGLICHGLLLNSGLSRPGEPLVCTPEDTLNYVSWYRSERYDHGRCVGDQERVFPEMVIQLYRT